MKRRPLLSAALAALLWAAPSAAEEQTPVTVFAAASLTESLQQVAADWTAKGNPEVVFSFDASSRLARQIEAGAPADLFFSADAEWMDYLSERGRIDPASRRELLSNRLVVVLPAASEASVAAAADLARPEIARIGLAGENVPAGRYGRAALQSLGVWGAIEARAVSGDNVRTVLKWTASGEVDAGLVYATDARVESGVRVALELPLESHPRIVYPAAVVAGAARADAAAGLLAYCQSAEGMGVFLAAGFSAASDGAASSP